MKLTTNPMKINMGNNEIRFISSYEDIIKIKLNNNRYVIKPQEYLSMLFNNLGYSLRPANFYELNCLYPLKDIQLQEQFEFPKMNYSDLIFDQKIDTLSHFINVMNKWIVNKDIERGHLLDLKKSFNLPTDYEIEFNLKNNITMQRNGIPETEISYWNKNDILTRRLYNINPKVDKEYFDKCIKQYSIYFDKVRICHPWIVFISCIIDPDLFFNAIRTAEKQAFDYVYNNTKDTCLSPILIKDDELIKPFEFFLNVQIMYMNILYNKKGYSGFMIQNQIPSEIETISSHLPIDTEEYHVIGNNITLDQNTINYINNQIFGTILDGDHKSYILQYVDINSLNILNDMGEDSIVRKNSYKKLYYVIMQIKEFKPELLNRKDKFLFSSPFYVNQEIFALYHKTRNTFFITFPDLILREMSPKKAIEFYKLYLNIDVQLNSKEMMGSYDSAKVPYIDIKYLIENEPQQQINNNIPLEIPSISSTSKNDNDDQQQQTNETIPEFTENVEIPEQQYIGYDIENSVLKS